MAVNCCVLGCFDVGKYSLPYQYPVRWKNWLSSCPYLQQYNLQQLECKRICSKHFIPEHFDLDTNSLSEDAVPLLSLPIVMPKNINEMAKVTETEEAIQILEDTTDPSVDPSSTVDESTYYDSEEYIEIQYLEEIETDPLLISPKKSPIDFEDHEKSVMAYSPPQTLQMSPKPSPIDFDGYEEAVLIANSPPQEPNPLEEPTEFTENLEYSESSSIIKPEPTKVPQVVLHRLPPNLKTCKVIASPPMVPKPQPKTAKEKKQNDNLKTWKISASPPMVPTSQPTTAIEKKQNGNLKTLKVCLSSPMVPTSPPNTAIEKKQNDNRHKPLILRHNLKDKQISFPPALLNPPRQYVIVEKKLLKNTLDAYKNKNKQLPNFPKTKLYLNKYNVSSTFRKVLLESQIRQIRTASEGVHYTTKDKIFALSLNKQSRKGYEFLQKQLGLPPKDNIESMLDDIPLWPGINEFIFQHLSDAATHKTAQEKECALLFGEMKIDKYVKFNTHTGIIEGFQDLGSGKRANKVGDKALVFMLCGLFQLWKLPIAYYITGDLFESNNVIFQQILTEILVAIFQTGFVVKATISDHSSTNVEGINSFLANTDDFEDNVYYKINNKWLYHIYDVTNISERLKIDSRNDDKGQNGHGGRDFLPSVFDETHNQLKSSTINRLTDLEYWNFVLCKLNSVKIDLQDDQTKLMLVNLIKHNLETSTKAWQDHQAFVRRFNLKPLHALFNKIRGHGDNITNINSNRFIIAYRNELINNLKSGKSLYTNTATQDEKVLSVLKNFINPKKYGPYYEDADLEHIIYYVERITTGLLVVKAISNFFTVHKPYKECHLCQQSIKSPDQNINIAVWKSINEVDELLPEVVNVQVYPLILILQQELDISWFTCAVHKNEFFRIFWAYIIKCRAKKWCSYFNIQEGFSEKTFFIRPE